MGWFKRIFFSAHYRIERFTAVVVSLTLVLLMCASVGVLSQLRANKEVLATNAMYTTQFVSSKSGLQGNVQGIYRSTDGKGVMCLLKFQDTSRFSSDAKDYRFFLTGADVEGNASYIRHVPTGMIYMFGATGYMGIYLYNASGFDVQVFDMVVRNNAEMPNLSSLNSESSVSYKDASFSNFDQFRIYFNPGASDIQVIPALDDDTIDVVKLFSQIVSATAEKEIKLDCDKSLAKMHALLNSINEYRRQIDYYKIVDDGVNTLKVVVPADPVGIQGDVIEVNKDDNGNTIGYTYKPASVVAGGVQFDYSKMSLNEGGYLKAVVPSDVSYSKFMSDLSLLQSEYINTRMTWYLSNGDVWMSGDSRVNSPLNTGMNGSNADVRAVNTAINNLIQAWSDYYNEKCQYQSGLLVELLSLEMQTESIRTNYSVNGDEDVIMVY